MHVAAATSMRVRRFHEIHLALGAQVLGIAIAAGASCARTEPAGAAPRRPVVHQVTEYAPVFAADPMATPDAKPPPPDAAKPPDGALPPPDAQPPPIPPRVAPDAQPLLPRPR